MKCTKCKIIGTNKELNTIGIGYDISNIDAEITHDYNDGWYEVTITFISMPEYSSEFQTISFDIPKDLVKIK